MQYKWASPPMSKVVYDIFCISIETPNLSWG